MKTKFSLVAVFVILSLLLTACSISITTKVNADGTGEMGFAYKFTKDELASLGSYGMSADTICTDMQSQGDTGLPSDMTMKQETHGDETWCVATQKFADLEALKSEMSSGSGFVINTMEIKDGKFTFDGSIDMSSSGTGTEGMPFTFTINYDLTAPGSIDKGKSNADKYDGNTATWNVPLTEVKSMHLESSTEGGGGGGINLGGGSKSIKVGSTNISYLAIVIVCCCCLLLVVIVAVVVFFVLKRKPKQPGM